MEAHFVESPIQDHKRPWMKWGDCKVCNANARLWRYTNVETPDAVASWTCHLKSGPHVKKMAAMRSTLAPTAAEPPAAEQAITGKK